MYWMVDTKAPKTRLTVKAKVFHAFDLWIEAWRQTVATGDVIVDRYADDPVVGPKTEWR